MASSRYTTEQVKKAIESSYSWKQVCEKVGLKYAGGNAETMKKIANTHSFDYSHFLGQGWNIGGNVANEIPPEDVFVLNSRFTHRSFLKKKALKYGLLGECKCSECGVGEEWNGKFLVIQLDHINGDATDNRIKNLRFLCPNCHSQTETYCVKKDAVRKICKKCGISVLYNNKTGYCKKCYMVSDIFKKHLENICNKSNGVEILEGMSVEELTFLTQNLTLAEIGEKFKISKSSVSRVCISMGIKTKCKSRVNTRKFQVSKEELSNLMEEKSFCEIGRMFGVSDNAIRKRVKRLGII